MYRKIKATIITLILSITMIIPANVTTVSAATKAKTGTNYTLKVAGKKKVYKSVGATYNGKAISTYAPGYIYNNNAMYSAYYVFKKTSGLKTSYTYKNNKITLKRGSTTMTMNRDSNYAYVNGKKTKMPTPARRVYSYKNKKYYIYVPGSFCASKLGIKYNYSSSKRVGAFTVATSSSSTATTSSAKSLTTGASTKISASSSNYSMRIKKPSGLSASNISTTDDYRNKRLRIIVKGNYKSFFANGANRKRVSTFKSYTVSYSGGKTYINLKTSSIKGFSVTQSDSYIYVKYATPRSMFSRVIVVDAGHGGSDSGAVGNGYVEKTMALKIVKEMKKSFDKNPKYKVYYTRLSDWYPSLSYRYKLANEVNANRFLSVHINSASSSAKGTETLYKSYKTYAKKIQKYALVGMGRSANGSYNRGLKYRKDLAVLNGPKMTTSLAELGFISNKTEAKRINSRTATIGLNLYKGIDASF